MSDEDPNPFARVLRDIKLIEVGRFFSDPRTQRVLHEKLDEAGTGARVKEGARKPRPRRHELRELIERTYSALASGDHKPTYQEVLNALRQYDHEDTIQDFTDNEIHWIDSRGHEHRMTFGTLRNHLARIRSSDN